MSRFKNVIINACVLGAVLMGFNVFASEFDTDTGKLAAPEMVLVREDAAGNRTLLKVEKAPAEITSDAEMVDVIRKAEDANDGADADEGGAEGSAPSEFDHATGTAAWYYWYYPNTYNCWYSYGYYSYYPRYNYRWGSYRYSYYYRY